LIQANKGNQTMTTETIFNITLNLDYRALKAAAMACIQKQDRFPHRKAMHCVALDISPQGVVAVATDGHTLIAMKAGEGVTDVESATVLIPFETIDRLKLSKATNDCTITLSGLITTWGPKKVTGTLLHDGSSVAFTGEEEPFPAWRRIFKDYFPKGCTSHKDVGHFNPANISKMQQAYSLFLTKKDKLRFVQIVHNGQNAARVVFDGVDGEGLIMPLKGDNSFPSLATWIK
jgi:hypothetical protein